MNVRMRDSGKTLTVKDAWGARLVEQGRADIVPPSPTAKPKKAAAKKGVKKDEPENEDRA